MAQSYLVLQTLPLNRVFAIWIPMHMENGSNQDELEEPLYLQILFPRKLQTKSSTGTMKTGAIYRLVEGNRTNCIPVSWHPALFV